MRPLSKKPNSKQYRAADWLIAHRHSVPLAEQGTMLTSTPSLLRSLHANARPSVRNAPPRNLLCASNRVAGANITSEMWDAFWIFYQDTGARKWGQPYLTRAFFDIIGESMKDSLVLFLAYDGDTTDCWRSQLRKPRLPLWPILGLHARGALPPFRTLLLSGDRLLPSQHGLPRVEAGAQGEHKLARGYEAVPTYSAHYIANAWLPRSGIGFSRTRNITPCSAR